MGLLLQCGFNMKYYIEHFATCQRWDSRETVQSNEQMIPRAALSVLMMSGHKHERREWLLTVQTRASLRERRKQRLRGRGQFTAAAHGTYTGSAPARKVRKDGRTSALLGPFKVKDVTRSWRLKTTFESQDDCADRGWTRKAWRLTFTVGYVKLHFLR